MRPEASTVETVSTVAGGAQVMGIDPEGMGMILKVLSNLYGDPSLAVVREYSSNALDSHVEAGNPDPILITSPSHFEPTFTVRDFGTGLSRDEVLNVYAQYGASTKRDTDTQIGSFGVGAKSAFAVGTQFIVTAVKNGMQTIALFALNDSGAPTVNIISHQATLEPNGVKVEVGVRDVDGINNAIGRLFPTWKRGSVLIDGVEPSCVWDDLEKIADDLYLGFRIGDRFSSGDLAFTVVMGGIPYKVPAAVISSLSMRYRNIINNVQRSQIMVYRNVLIGAVDITPSREDLKVTAKTIAVIQQMADELMKWIGPWVTQKISGADSVGLAVIEYYKLAGSLGGLTNDVLTHITWHGKALPTTRIVFSDIEYFVLHSRGYYGDKNARRTKGTSIHPDFSLSRLLFVTNVPERRNRSVQLAAKPYLMNQDKNTGHNKVVALPGKLSDYKQDWFDPEDPAFTMTDFDTFVKEWKPKPTPAQRGEVKYQVYEETDPFTVAELNTMGKIFYLVYGQRHLPLRNNPLVTVTIGDQEIVLLAATQKPEVFVKRVPSAIALPAAMMDKAREILGNPDPGDEEILFSQSVLKSADDVLFRFLVARKTSITNPVVLEAVGYYEKAIASRGKSMDRLGMLRMAAQLAAQPMPVSKDGENKLKTIRKVANDLPLLYPYISNTRYGQNTPLGDKHVIDYVNSIDLYKEN